MICASKLGWYLEAGLFISAIAGIRDQIMRDAHFKDIIKGISKILDMVLVNPTKNLGIFCECLTLTQTLHIPF